jgi:predicted hydrolase (HD superfamily)
MISHNEGAGETIQPITGEEQQRRETYQKYKAQALATAAGVEGIVQSTFLISPDKVGKVFKKLTIPFAYHLL